MKAIDLGTAQFHLNKSKDINQLAERKAKDAAEIKKLSQDFEAIFLQIVLKSMRDSVQKSGLVDGGNGEEIFKSMLDSEYSKSMAKQGSSGLAKSIESFLLEQGGYENKVAQKMGIKKYQSE